MMCMKKLPKDFDVLSIEEKWQRRWMELDIYRFDREDKVRPPFVIDTPPPYPSGDFHMGNVLNWTYFDIAARFKRMLGYNVLFPQGWDCHGLPTEVETEERYGVKKTEVPPEEFRKLCEEFVAKYIDLMKRAIIRLGCSIDWNLEYRTMNPDYWRKTQLSFVILYRKGYIYQGKHPINWCPRCVTAIADAEVEHESREGKLHYINFRMTDGSKLPIATTRPELIPSCVAVAVHPSDERYAGYIGKTVTIPLFGREVPVIGDESVDPDFGTGAVMICTYGDKDDVKTVARNRLPVVMSLDEEGRMTENASKYQGLSVAEARKAIVKDLGDEGYLEKIETIRQEVGVCWRCKTPVEILEQTQWFMKTRILTDRVEEEAYRITWYPEHMRDRLIDWARSLDWDWVISRQRVFATPIPIWYCINCGEIILAEPEWLPIDPKLEPPKIGRCPKCGSTRFKPETSVLDTWFDSSITCAVHAGWPDKEDWMRFFPSDVHPSGADIIRTWAHYLMVRHLALFDEKPFKSCLINGMVLGTDGRKMSKSLGNYIATDEVFSKYGADATRQWAAGGGSTGSDIPFRWADVEYGWRFLRKLWNAARFISMNLEDFDPKVEAQPEIIDRWLMSKLEKVKSKVTEALNNYQFNVAIESVRGFIWHILCDQYIEAVKHRLYNPEIYGEGSRRAAQQTLYNVLFEALQLLAPISPHITEEIYEAIFKEHEGYPSVHVSPWPKPVKGKIDEEDEKTGDLIIAVINCFRREKARNRIPLNAKVSEADIYAGEGWEAEVLKENMEIIKGTCKIEHLNLSKLDDVGQEVEGYPNVRVKLKI